MRLAGLAVFSYKVFRASLRRLPAQLGASRRGIRHLCAVAFRRTSCQSPSLYARLNLEIGKNIRDKLRPYRPTALIACLLHHEAQLKKGAHVGLTAKAEYCALLLLESIDDNGAVPQWKELERISESLDAAFDEARSNLERTSEMPLYDTLRGRIATPGLWLRNPAVPQHWRMLLERFAHDCDPKIERFLPYSFPQALVLQKSIVDVSMQRMQRWRESWEGRADRIWRANRARVTHTLDEGDQKLLVAAKAARKYSIKRAITSFAWQAALPVIDEPLFVSLDDLVQTTGIDRSVCEAFLETFTVTTPPEEHRLLPSPYNALTRTPLIRTSRGRFMAHPALLLWALLPRIEELLKDHSKEAFERYERCRSRFLVSMTAELFSKVSDSVRVNIDYNDEQGVRRDVDVLAVFDTTAYVIECKAASLSPATWRGGPKSVEHDLVDLLEVGLRQAYLGVEAMKLARSDFSLGEVTEFVPLMITMDHLDTIGVSAKAAENAGLRTGAWIMSLATVYTLVDLLETAHRFKHYCRRRLLVDSERFTIAIDELDFFDWYCIANICAFPPAPNYNLVMALTEEASDYYFQLDGPKPIAKPRPPKMLGQDRLIADLALSRQLGWSEVVCDLLDFKYAMQEQTSKRMESAQRRSHNGDAITTRLMLADLNVGILYCAVGSAAMDTMLTLSLSSIDATMPERWLVVCHEFISHRVQAQYVSRAGAEWVNAQAGFRLGEDAWLVSAN